MEAGKRDCGFERRRIGRCWLCVRELPIEEADQCADNLQQSGDLHPYKPREAAIDLFKRWDVHRPTQCRT